MKNEDVDESYEVGYRKPPRHTQFKPGCSGNPKGRPRGSENAGAIVKRVLFAPLVVSEAGRRRKISKFEAMMTRAVNSAIKGDFRMLGLLLDLPWVASELAQPNLARPLSAMEALQRARELVMGM